LPLHQGKSDKNLKSDFAVLIVMIMKSTVFWDLLQLKFTDISWDCNALIFLVKEQAKHVTSNKHSMPCNETGLQYRPVKELRELIGAWGRVVSAGPKMGKVITDCKAACPRRQSFSKP
jgi:hypothetical protein